MSDRTYRRAVDLLEADISDEMVALEPNGGNCFGFNEVAKDVWRLLERPQSFVAIQNYLLEEYDVEREECARDLRELITEMKRAKLVEEVKC